MGYEKKNQPLAHQHLFAKRMLKNFLITILIMSFSLGIGVLGYATLEGMKTIDALLNAAMLLGGMGPVDVLKTNGGKLFASFYALYAGMVFVLTAGILLAPMIHRLMHHFHLLDDE